MSIKKKKVIQDRLLQLLYSNYENENENLLQQTHKPTMDINHVGTTNHRHKSR